MNKRILLDLDGVIADFVAAAVELHKPSNPVVSSWNFFEEWGLTARDFWGPMGYNFWVNVPKTTDAVQIVQMCEEAVGSRNVCLLTAPCYTKGCRDGKRDWIRKHFPQYHRRHLIGAPKEFCASPNSLLVDDSDTNCETFANWGGHFCLYPNQANKARDNAHIAIEVLKKALIAFVREEV
jgi:hypothetical protein